MPRTRCRPPAGRARLTAASALFIGAAISGCTTAGGTHVGLLSGTGPVVALIGNDFFVGQRSNTRIQLASTSRAGVSCVGENLVTGSITGHADIRCTDGTVASIPFTHTAVGSLEGYGRAETPTGPVSYTYGMRLSDAVKHLDFAPGTVPDLTGPTPRVRSLAPDSRSE